MGTIIPPRFPRTHDAAWRCAELIAAAFSAGVWVIEKQGEAWKSKCIETDSGGFEHASYLADIDGTRRPSCTWPTTTVE